MKEAAENIKSCQPVHLQNVVELTYERGASNWVLHYPYLDMGLTFIKVLSGILSVIVVAGHILICQSNVLVVQI